LSQHISWNRFLGHLLKLRNDRGAAVHGVLLGGMRRHDWKTRDSKNKKQSLH
jgi:hypothetical protein